MSMVFGTQPVHSLELLICIKCLKIIPPVMSKNECCCCMSPGFCYRTIVSRDDRPCRHLTPTPGPAVPRAVLVPFAPSTSAAELPPSGTPCTPFPDPKPYPFPPVESLCLCPTRHSLIPSSEFSSRSAPLSDPEYFDLHSFVLGLVHPQGSFPRAVVAKFPSACLQTAEMVSSQCWRPEPAVALAVGPHSPKASRGGPAFLASSFWRLRVILGCVLCG